MLFDDNLVAGNLLDPRFQQRLVRIGLRLQIDRSLCAARLEPEHAERFAAALAGVLASS